MSSVHRIIMESSTYQDKRYMMTLTESEKAELNGTLITNLYRSILSRNTVDFGDIPDSMGDIDKVKYYSKTLECLNILESAKDSNNFVRTGVSEVKTCMNNIRNLKPLFNTGFRIHHEFSQIIYNTMVMSCIDATSMLIAEYVNYCMGSDTIDKTTSGIDKKRGVVCLDCIKQFNKMYTKGDVAKSLSYMIEEQKKSALGETIVISTIVISAILAIVPLIRELIYFFYRSKVSLSNYLEMEARFLELHKSVVESSTRPASEKKKILAKQAKAINDLRKWSDKLMVNNENVHDMVVKDISDENRGYSLSNIESQLSHSKLNDTSTNISFI